MGSGKPGLRPARLLKDHVNLLSEARLPGPLLDLACGEGDNAVFLASMNLPVICCDNSRDALNRARSLAAEHNVFIEAFEVDLEQEGVNPLQQDIYGAIVVFRYLHRPLMHCVRKALKPGGILIYETFTVEQAKYGKPTNPDFLLRPGELRDWFSDWEVIHYFEGVKDNPERAVAQLICRKSGE